MNKRIDPPFATGQITTGLPKNGLILRIIEFVRSQLPAWRDDPNRRPKEAENDLNSQLCDFLDVRAREKFPMVHFKTERSQTGRSKADLSVSPVESIVIGAKKHTIYDPILVLEGKRLPPPSTKRNKEYVTGYEKRSGGIQRFKLGIHGSQMAIAAMVGYIQENTIPHWRREINRWITELANGQDTDGGVWTAKENLNGLVHNTNEEVAHCCSIHGRLDNDCIQLQHLWIVMNRRKQK